MLKRVLAEKEKLELTLQEAKEREERSVIDPVKQFLKEKALHNVQAIQTDADNSREPLDRFQMRRYLIGLAGFTEKQAIEHSGKVEFQPIVFSRGKYERS